MKIELHAHTAESSDCAVLTAAQTVNAYIDAGYGAIVITDHFIADEINPRKPKKAVDRLLRGYSAAIRAAEGTPLTVIFGMELRMYTGYEDFLVFGVTESALERTEKFCDMIAPDMHAWAMENGLFIAQAHPYRWGCRPIGAQYLSGIEVYNANPRQDSHNDRALAYAEEHHMRRLAGSDSHYSEDVGLSGIIVPDDAAAGLTDSVALAAYLRDNQPELIAPAGF